jgi:hypothetical protein
MTADPKPVREKRRKGGRTLRDQVYDPAANKRKLLGEPDCRICGKPAGGCHHLVPKGGPHYGDDVEENLVPLCGSGTTGCHGKIEDYDGDACVELGARLSVEETEYVLGKLGEMPGREFLLRRYRIMVPLTFNGRPSTETPS